MLTEYQKAPAVTRDRLYIDTMQQVYSNVSKVMIDSRSGSNLLYLPLDKLMQQTGVSRPCARPRRSRHGAPTRRLRAGSADVRSRDGQRGRDREAAERRRTRT